MVNLETGLAQSSFPLAMIEPKLLILKANNSTNEVLPLYQDGG